MYLYIQVQFRNPATESQGDLWKCGFQGHPRPAELGVGIAQETGSVGNLDACLCWPHGPQKPMDGDRGNLSISKIQEKFVSGLRIGYLASMQLLQSPWPGLMGTLLVEGVEVEKVADQRDGGHSGPEGGLGHLSRTCPCPEDQRKLSALLFSLSAHSFHLLRYIKFIDTSVF